MARSGPPDGGGAVAARSGIRAVFALPGYPSIFAGRLANASTQAFCSILLLLLVARLSDGSPFDVALMWLVGRLPAIFVGPFIGVVVDRVRKRHVMAAALWAQAIVVALLAVHPSFAGYLAANFLLVAGYNLVNQAQGALLPEIARDHGMLQRATAMSRTVTDAAQVVGYALSGAALLGHAVVLGLLACTVVYALGGAAVVILPLSADRISVAASRAPFLESLGDGARAMVVRPDAMRLQLALAIQAVIGGAVNAVLVLVPERVAHAASVWYAPLEATQSAAMLGFGLVLAGGFAMRRTLLLGLSIAAMGIGIGALALTPAIGPDFAWYVLVGLGNIVFLTVVLPVFRRAFPVEVRGRAIGLNSMVVNASQLVGILIAGVVAENFGVGPVLLMGGALMVAMAVTSLLTSWIPTESADLAGAAAVPQPGA